MLNRYYVHLTHITKLLTYYREHIVYTVTE